MWSLGKYPVDGRYEIIYADPPWNYNDSGCEGGTRAHYNTLPTVRIANIPIPALAAENAALFMWATYPMLPEALSLMTAWGFKYKSIAFQWVKVYPSGSPRFGLGRWTRGNTEPCLLALKGDPKRVDKGVSQVIMTEELVCEPIGRHSAKPPIVREKIIRLMGDRPAVELFARERVPGWDCWGDDPALQSPLTLEGGTDVS